jgi:hypothetical protein
MNRKPSVFAWMIVAVISAMALEAVAQHTTQGPASQGASTLKGDTNDKKSVTVKNTTNGKTDKPAKGKTDNPTKIKAQVSNAAKTSNDNTWKKEIAALRQEIEKLKTALPISDKDVPAITQPTFTAEQEKQKQTLQEEIKQTEQELASYRTAIEQGLDAAVIQANIDAASYRLTKLKDELLKLDAEVASTQLEAISPDKKTEEKSLSDKVEAQSKEIADLKTELNSLKEAESRRKNEEDAAKKQAKKEDESESVSISELLPIELFAFGDIFYAYRQSEDDGMEIGQLELDVTQKLGTHLAASVGVAFNGEAFGVGYFTIDGRLAGRNEEHLIHSEFVETSGIIFGKFDVPFGIDYLEYASPSRPLVTGPLAVEKTHAAWNDLGGQFYLKADRFNFVAYGVNGFGYETLIPESDMEPGDEDTTYYHATDGAVGARVGLKPVKQLELGGSFAALFTKDIGLDMLLAGGDICLQAAGLSLKGEYIFHYLGVSSEFSARNHGIYGTLMYDFERVFAVARYSTFIPEKNNPDFSVSNDVLKQFSVGIGVRVQKMAEIRVEYSSDLESGGSMVFVQLVGGAAWQPSGLRR